MISFLDHFPFVNTLEHSDKVLGVGDTRLVKYGRPELSVAPIVGTDYNGVTVGEGLTLMKGLTFGSEAGLALVEGFVNLD